MRIFLLLALLARMPLSYAADSVTMPLEEFKRLYGGAFKAELEAEREKAVTPFVYTTESAAYHLSITDNKAHVDVALQGRVLGGGFEAFDLFHNDVALAKIDKVEGGTLLNGGTKIRFLPNSETFNLHLQLLLAVGEDAQSEYVRFHTPAGVNNRLTLALPEIYRIVDHPGIGGDDGAYYFAGSDTLEVRFEKKTTAAGADTLETDIVNVFQIQGKRGILTSYFVPLQKTATTLTVRLPQNVQYLSSTLKPSRIQEQVGNLLVLPAKEGDVFLIRFSVAVQENGVYNFTLPAIAGNSGREDALIVEEPDHGRLTPDKEYPRMALNHLSAMRRLGDIPAQSGQFFQVSADQTVSFTMQLFAGVDTPEVVLDSQYFFLSFEESGAVLTVLKMQIPPAAGARLVVQRVSGAKIWSLTVNREKKGVYSTEDENWIIPLAKNGTSDVELAYLLQGNKLALQGRLDTLLPRTGLPVRHLYVGIALPERVDLVSLEADISPVVAEKWPVPATFIGKPYYFSRAFYNGDGLRTVVFYKEPVIAGGQGGKP